MEQSVLLDFVQSGGAAIVFPDNDSFGIADAEPVNQSLIDPFLMNVQGTLPGRQNAVVSDPSGHQITSGSFGTVESFSQNYPGGLQDVGPYAVSLAENDLGSALAVIDPGTLGSGSGAVVVYSDINTFGDSDASGFFSENEALFLNSFSFLFHCAADAGGGSCSQKDTDGDGVNDCDDQCPGTADGVETGADGCSCSQKDADGDGVTDCNDE